MQNSVPGKIHSDKELSDLLDFSAVSIVVKLEHNTVNKLFRTLYSFGKWWKWKISRMGFVYWVVWVLNLWTEVRLTI